MAPSLEQAYPYQLDEYERESVRQLLQQIRPLQTSLNVLLNHIVRSKGLMVDGIGGYQLNEDGTVLIPQAPPNR